MSSSSDDEEEDFSHLFRPVRKSRLHQTQQQQQQQVQQSPQHHQHQVQQSPQHQQQQQQQSPQHQHQVQQSPQHQQQQQQQSPQHQQQSADEDEADEEEEDEDEEQGDEGGEDRIGDEENYFTILSELSKQWLFAELHHNVSAEAVNSFWSVAMDFIPKLSEHKNRTNIEKKTPNFIQQRRKLYQDLCPPIHMKKVYEHKETKEIQTIWFNENTVNTYERNPAYIKLYEESHVKVNIYICYIRPSVYSPLICPSVRPPVRPVNLYVHTYVCTSFSLKRK